MTVEWVSAPHRLLRLEGDREDIDALLRSVEAGEESTDILRRAEEYGVDAEIHP